MSEQKPLTAREFVGAVGGVRCPRCGSQAIGYSEPRVEGQSLFEDGECSDCGCEFYTVLRLGGTCDLESEPFGMELYDPLPLPDVRESNSTDS